MHADLNCNADARSAWNNGCIVGMTIAVPDGVRYGSDPCPELTARP